MTNRFHAICLVFILGMTLFAAAQPPGGGHDGRGGPGGGAGGPGGGAAQGFGGADPSTAGQGADRGSPGFGGHGSGARGPGHGNGHGGGLGGHGRQQLPSPEQLAGLDVNGDGILSADEISRSGLQGILQSCDQNSDGQVSAAEIQAAAAAASAAGFGGWGGANAGMTSGPAGGGTSSRPGEIMTVAVQDQLQMTAAQRQELAVLQQEVNLRLSRILTPAQVQAISGADTGGGFHLQSGADGTAGRSRSQGRSGTSGRRSNRQ